MTLPFCRLPSSHTYLKDKTQFAFETVAKLLCGWYWRGAQLIESHGLLFGVGHKGSGGCSGLGWAGESQAVCHREQI